MKLRTGFVSNSSSSSYIVNKDISDIINCVLLNDEQRENVLAYLEKEAQFWSGEEKAKLLAQIEQFRKEPFLYVTQFIDDCDSRYEKLHEQVKEEDYMYYMGGQHGGSPYDPDMFNSLLPGVYDEEGVWLHYEHDDCKTYKTKDIPKHLKAHQYRVKYLENGKVELTPQDND